MLIGGVVLGAVLTALITYIFELRSQQTALEQRNEDQAQAAAFNDLDLANDNMLYLQQAQDQIEQAEAADGTAAADSTAAASTDSATDSTTTASTTGVQPLAAASDAELTAANEQLERGPASVRCGGLRALRTAR